MLYIYVSDGPRVRITVAQHRHIYNHDDPRIEYQPFSLDSGQRAQHIIYSLCFNLSVMTLRRCRRLNY